jgi:glycerol uptake facilitator-like aquaporin
MRISLHITELPARFKKLLCEAVGTFYLVLTVSMTLQQAVVDAPIAIGFMLMTQVFAYGYISGGHFNPAVTAGLTLCSLLDVGEMLQYWAAQLIGGLLASMLSWFLVGVDQRFVAPQPFSGKGIDIFRAFVSEMVFTASLVSVVLNVACSKQKNNHHYGLAIGCSVLCAAFAVGGISGGAFNPAVATSLHLVKCMAHDCSVMKYNPVFWAADLTGSLLAAVVFCLIHPIERSHLPNQRQANANESEALFVEQESFVNEKRITA